MQPDCNSLVKDLEEIRNRTLRGLVPSMEEARTSKVPRNEAACSNSNFTRERIEVLRGSNTIDPSITTKWIITTIFIIIAKTIINNTTIAK